jgi:glutaredoxin 3
LAGTLSAPRPFHHWDGEDPDVHDALVRLLRPRQALLAAKEIDFDEISLDDDPGFRQRLFELTGGWTVPQIVIDGEPIGGYTELWRLDREGRLDERLAA